MKLPSIEQVVSDSGRTLRRFPFVVFDAVIGTVSGLILLDHEGPPQPTLFFNILFAAILGIPLLFAITITAEKRGWNPSLSLGSQMTGVLALAAYAWSLPTDLANAPNIHLLRLLMIAAGLLLFVAVAPYARPGETNGYWHYNEALLLRILTAALYSAVLFAGLSVALLALDRLFGMDVPGKRYGELWILIVGLFAIWFFLAGVPESLESLEASTEYPRGIKIFAQYILLPLVLVYLVILYAYLVKISIAWDWPQGWVSRLILGFSSAGMLMHLLFYPVRDHVENVWIKSTLRWLYVAMAPLAIMLLLAVWRRVSEYGLTEERYIGVAIGLWLAAIVLYFIFSKGKSIKAIPASLGMVGLLMSFGPWGAFSISESSQVDRLREVLTKSSILVDGTVHPAAKPVPFLEEKQISSIVGYLHDVHGYDRIQPWFRESLRADSTGGSMKFEDPSDVTKLMGIEYVRVWEGAASNDINLRADAEQAIGVGGYDRLWRAQVYTPERKRREVPGGGFGYETNPGLDTLTLFAMEKGTPTDSIRVDVKQFVERLQADYKNANAVNIPPEKMSITLADGHMRVKLYLLHVYGRRQNGVLKITTYELAILYSLPVN
jgi:hypothetical protein